MQPITKQREIRLHHPTPHNCKVADDPELARIKEKAQKAERERQEREHGLHRPTPYKYPVAYDPNYFSLEDATVESPLARKFQSGILQP